MNPLTSYPTRTKYPDRYPKCLPAAPTCFGHIFSSKSALLRFTWASPSGWPNLTSLGPMIGLEQLSVVGMPWIFWPPEMIAAVRAAILKPQGYSSNVKTAFLFHSTPILQRKHKSVSLSLILLLLHVLLVSWVLALVLNFAILTCVTELRNTKQKVVKK